MSFWSSAATVPAAAAPAGFAWDQAWQPCVCVTCALIVFVLTYKFVWEFLKLLTAVLALVGAWTVWVRCGDILVVTTKSIAWASGYFNPQPPPAPIEVDFPAGLWSVFFGAAR
jgi:hypothetical protein